MSNQAKVGTDAEVFPFPAVGGDAPVVSGGDAAVILKDSKAAQALATFLALPDAATIQAKLGGYLSPNKSVDASAYPNHVQRKMAQALIAAGDDFRFDMSDQAPQAFGEIARKGEWKALQDFLKNPKDIPRAPRRSWRPTPPPPTGTDPMASTAANRSRRAPSPPRRARA
ncbi:hypothetical protein SFUMM280S_07188 [Streptomyces fumanus]